MPDERDTGIILRKYPLSETSLIVHWLTKQHGRISTAAKGVYRPKSKFYGKLDLFFLSELVFVKSQRSDLHTLKEVSIIETFPFIRSNLPALHSASYCAVLIEKITEKETPIPEIASLYQLLLEQLNSPAIPASSMIFAFEAHLLMLIGEFPELEKTSLTKDAKEFFKNILDSGLKNTSQIMLSPELKSEIGEFLQEYLDIKSGKINRLRANALNLAN